MNNVTISKEEIFKLLLCVISNMYKKVESYEYTQSNLKLYTYKIASYKYDKSGLNF